MPKGANSQEAREQGIEGALTDSGSPWQVEMLAPITVASPEAVALDRHTEYIRTYRHLN